MWIYSISPAAAWWVSASRSRRVFAATPLCSCVCTPLSHPHLPLSLCRPGCSARKGRQSDKVPGLARGGWPHGRLLVDTREPPRGPRV